MLMVVNHDSNDNGHVQLKDVERYKDGWAGFSQFATIFPKKNEKDGSEYHEKNGTDIGFIFKHNEFFCLSF
jgi:hypothetical protein